VKESRSMKELLFARSPRKALVQEESLQEELSPRRALSKEKILHASLMPFMVAF
jgi:hypothetical protein